jgi:hypothetical protein
MVFASAMLGMLIRRRLAESDLNDETKNVVTLSIGVVGTLTALVLSLLIATASSMFNTRNQAELIPRRCRIPPQVFWIPLHGLSRPSAATSVSQSARFSSSVLATWSASPPIELSLTLIGNPL